MSNEKLKVLIEGVWESSSFKQRARVFGLQKKDPRVFCHWRKLCSEDQQHLIYVWQTKHNITEAA